MQKAQKSDAWNTLLCACFVNAALALPRTAVAGPDLANRLANRLAKTPCR